ncbi:MAG TPA: 4Fe-4S binding protein [Clostridiales bacterium]|nr:4Fe-4S binding protein [Clostridiales bacterium]
MSTLEQVIGGIRFRSPLVIGAGPLSDRVDLIKKAADCGAGAVSIKQTAWTEPRPGVRKMCAQRGLYFFNPSDRRLNPQKTAELIRQSKEVTDIPLLANILGAGENVGTWVELGQQLEDAGADGLELNFACPNPPAKIGEGGFQYGASMSQNPAKAADVISALTKAVDIPVWVKFSGDGTNTAALCAAAAEAGASGITAFCSPRGTFPIDIYNGGRPKLADLPQCSLGGVNGPAIRLASNRVVVEAAQAAPSLPIMGGGGISCAEHVIETIMFGASLTFIFTQVMLEGFEILTRLNSEILRFMEENGYETIGQIRGQALKYIVPNSELDYAIGPAAKVNPELCRGCGTCAKIAFCRAIELRDRKAKVDPERCECCGLCASLCPTNAIYF